MTTETTALTIPQQVEQALAYAATREKLLTLAADSARITEITNKAGYDECHAARMKLKDTRIAIDKTAKAAREDAIKFQREVIAKGNDLIALIEPEEKRLQALQDAEDARKEAIKQAAEREKAERLAKQTAWFDAIKELPLLAMNKSPAEIEGLIAKAEAASTDELAEDMVAAGKFTIRTTVLALRAALDARNAELAEQARVAAEQEAERQRVEAERAELAKLREQVEQQRKAAEEAAAEVERKARAEREAKEREEAARKAQEAAEAERVRQEQLAAERAERERVAAEQAKEAARLAAEREKLEADKKAAAKKAREQAIADATLYDAATEALALLRAKGLGDELATQKLASALTREPAKAAA